MKISISRLWNKIINVGITSDLVINETKYIRVTNGICFIAVLWLLPLSLFFIPLLPDSKNVLFNCIFFQLFG
jgi:hypothetical protein